MNKYSLSFEEIFYPYPDEVIEYFNGLYDDYYIPMKELKWIAESVGMDVIVRNKKGEDICLIRSKK